MPLEKGVGKGSAYVIEGGALGWGFMPPCTDEDGHHGPSMMVTFGGCGRRDHGCGEALALRVEGMDAMAEFVMSGLAVAQMHFGAVGFRAALDRAKQEVLIKTGLRVDW